MRSTAIMVGTVFGAQGLGYAAVVTALPAAKARLGVGDMAISAVLLGVCIAAACGSVLADRIAVRAGSRSATVLGFAFQGVALAAICLAPTMPVFAAAAALYGLGLGTVDAGNNMQGISLQTLLGKPVMGRLYAVFTASGILGALLASGVHLVGASPWALVGLVAAGQAAVAAGGRVWLVATEPSGTESPAAGVVPTGAGQPAVTKQTVPLPTAAIWAFGAMIGASFLLDAAISAWSTIYLADGLAASEAAAPVGYAAYLGMVLVARLCTDPAVLRFGRRAVAQVALAGGVLGGALVAAGPQTAVAIAGFGIAGLATGALVPIAFAAAGQACPQRADEVVARVNLFNYAGAVIGSVLPGVLGAGAVLRFGFLVPAIALVALWPTLRRLPEHAAPAQPMAVPAASA